MTRAGSGPSGSSFGTRSRCRVDSPFQLASGVAQGHATVALAHLLFSLTADPEHLVAIVGPTGAGKTTLLYQIKTQDTQKTIPTIGFNLETLEMGDTNFLVWDLGGQDKIRLIWRHYFQNTQAIVYVVDSANLEDIEPAKEELDRLLTDPELKDALLLVLANKQDLGGLSADEVSRRLGLAKIKDRVWTCLPLSAANGKGISNAFKWLTTNLASKIGK